MFLIMGPVTIRTPKQGYLSMSIKYKHQRTPALLSWNARGFNIWKTTQGDKIKHRAVFDMQPNHPELNIQPSGKCKVWIRGQPNCSSQASKDRSPPYWSRKSYKPSKSCYSSTILRYYKGLYTPDGKCVCWAL